jgi:uridine phosphorylase
VRRGPRAGATLPLLANKPVRAASVFTPEHLLREARRQKRLPARSVPEICVLDPDGDIVRHLVATHRARRARSWPCYHTRLHVYRDGRERLGIIGGAVGAPFAVLVAEELFAAGCRLLISVTSAGEIRPRREPPPYVVLIERALRDEGTSYHYQAPAVFSHADRRLIDRVYAALQGQRVPVIRGATWTTDAPFRETATTIRARRAQGLVAVEMEAAALYAFGRARGRPVVCFAHVTNRVGRAEGAFEKGAASGAPAALAVIGATARAWRVTSRARA